VPLFQTPGDIAWAVSVFTAVLTLVNGLINIYTKKRSSAAAAAAAAASTAAAAPEATPVVKNTHWRQKGDPKRGAPWYEHLPRRAVSSFLTHCVIFAIFISLPAVVGIANQWRGAGSTRNFVLVHTFEFNAVYGVLFSFAATRLTVSRLCHSEVVLVPKMLLLSLVAPLLVYVGIASDVIRTPRALAWIRARAIEPVVAVTLPALTAAFAGVPAHDPAAFFAQASQAVSSLTVTDCVTSLTAALARAAEATSNGIFGAATNTFCGVPWLYWLGGVILLAYCHFLIAVFHQFASYLRVNVLTMTTLQKRQVLVEIVARREQRQAKRAGQQGTPAPSPSEAQAHLRH
jgi:heme exporter protein D